MVQPTVKIVEEDEVGRAVQDLMKLGRFQVIKVCLPSSRDHRARVLPSDRILIKAWRCKERSDKGKYHR